MYHHCLRFQCVEDCCPNYSVFQNPFSWYSFVDCSVFFRFDISPTKPSPSRMLCHQIRLTWLWSFGHFITRLNLRRKRSWMAMVHMLESFRNHSDDPRFEVLAIQVSTNGVLELEFQEKSKLKNALISVLIPSLSSSLFVLSSETHAPRTTVADTASIMAPPGQGCPRCGGAVFAAEQMLSKGREWHRKCFKCNDCNKTLDSIIACDGPDKDVYCRTCYGKKWGPHGYGFACGSGFLQTDGQR